MQVCKLIKTLLWDSAGFGLSGEFQFLVPNCNNSGLVMLFSFPAFGIISLPSSISLLTISNMLILILILAHPCPLLPGLWFFQPLLASSFATAKHVCLLPWPSRPPWASKSSCAAVAASSSQKRLIWRIRGNVSLPKCCLSWLCGVRASGSRCGFRGRWVWELRWSWWSC